MCAKVLSSLYERMSEESWIHQKLFMVVRWRPFYPQIIRRCASLFAEYHRRCYIRCYSGSNNGKAGYSTVLMALNREMASHLLRKAETFHFVELASQMVLYCFCGAFSKKTLSFTS
jgi:hypothetical protein